MFSTSSSSTLNSQQSDIENTVQQPNTLGREQTQQQQIIDETILPLSPSITPSPESPSTREPYLAVSIQQARQPTINICDSRPKSSVNLMSTINMNSTMNISGNIKPSSVVVTSGGVSTLHIDTCLANQQSARHHEQSHQNKTIMAQQILSMIRDGDFEQFSTIVRYSKPDLNVFINGQTALHYCLLMGRDVSWCKLLVHNGANPNLSNQDGWHPLHLAAFKGLKDQVHYLNKYCNQKLTNNECQQNSIEATTRARPTLTNSDQADQQTTNTNRSPS